MKLEISGSSWPNRRANAARRIIEPMATPPSPPMSAYRTVRVSWFSSV